MTPNINRTSLAFALISSLTIGFMSRDAHAAPTRTPVTFTTVYTPKGFDSNDNVQFVGEGLFENACYRPAPTDLKVDQEKKVITVGPIAYKYNGLCLQVILPFDRIVDVGLLAPGVYTIIQSPTNLVLGSISVSPATTENPDDFLYAPISQAFFHQKDNISELYLTGDFPTSCMSLDDVKVDVQAKVITVQPIASVAYRTNCQAVRTPFDKVIKLENVPKGRYLLHVRSMNAKAINTLINVD